VSHWFRAIAASRSRSRRAAYLAGTYWPPICSRLIEQFGWRQTHSRSAHSASHHVAAGARGSGGGRRFDHAEAGLAAAPGAARRQPRRRCKALLVLAGLACCIAMSMPQVHIVAYCTGLGFSAQRGAELLSVMFATGVGAGSAPAGLPTASAAPPAAARLRPAGACPLLYMPFDGLMSLYVISALFGLSQGGIVPSYAIAKAALLPGPGGGGRIGLVLRRPCAGMAVGRLDVRRDLRPHRLLPGGFRQRPAVETCCTSPSPGGCSPAPGRGRAQPRSR